MWLSITVIVYLLSAAASYNWVKNAYSKGGVFHCNANNAGIVDFIFSFTPFVNTLFFIFMSLMGGISGKEHTSDSFTLNKLFGVRK